MDWRKAKAVHFHPWVGQDYLSGINGRRILVMGESHYGKPHQQENQAFTQKVVEGYVSGEFHDAKSRVFTVVARLILGNQSAGKSDCRALWQLVAFSNFLQEFAGASSRELKETVDWGRGRKAYLEIVEILKPDVVLLLGKRLARKANSIPLRGECRVAVKHPSGGMRYSEAMPKVQKALGVDGGAAEVGGGSPENENFIPFEKKDLSLARGRKYFQLVQLVNGVTEELSHEPFVSLRGLRAGGRLGSYGRHLRIHEFGCFLHLSPRRWIQTGITPLWLSVRDSDFKAAVKPRELLGHLEETDPPSVYLFDGVPHVPIHVQTGLRLGELVEDLKTQILDMTACLKGGP